VAGLKFLYRTTLKREWGTGEDPVSGPKENFRGSGSSESQSLFDVTSNLKQSYPDDTYSSFD